MVCTKWKSYSILFLAGLLLLPASAPAQAPLVQGEAASDGPEVYTQYCSQCHDNPEETRAVPLDTLKQMGPRAIYYALTNGKMRVQATPMSLAQINSVVGYLSATADIDNSWMEGFTCAPDRRAVDTGIEPTVAGFGINLENHRNMSAELAGLTLADMDDLELVWAMGFPQTANMRAQPAIVGNTLYISIADSGQLFALDIESSPCLKWAYEHSVPLRSAINTGTVDGRDVLVFSDAAAHVQMLDAASAELLWRANLRITSVANTTGMPVLYGDRVYAPVSTGELNMGAAEDYECCTSHGTVVALDAATGSVDWIYHTMEEATPRGVNSVGTQQWGPSGAPIWTTPAIDEERGVLYVGTGENNSVPATDTSDAILAINLEDGSLRWKFQATANDIYLTGCVNAESGPNCPPNSSIHADWDFGASVVIADRPDGSDMVLAGQKSGMLWALNADNGELIWNTLLGPGGASGGIHWGMAYDGENVYTASNQGNSENDPLNRDTGLHSVDVDTGEINWSFFNQGDCSGDRQQYLPNCASNYGLSAATLLVDGAVVQGGKDGYLRIFDAKDGNLLFKFDTARDFDTANGVKARGGAIDNASIVAANGMLIVQSGYTSTPGNLLLVFAPGQ